MDNLCKEKENKAVRRDSKYSVTAAPGLDSQDWVGGDRSPNLESDVAAEQNRKSREPFLTGRETIWHFDVAQDYRNTLETWGPRVNSHFHHSDLLSSSMIGQLEPKAKAYREQKETLSKDGGTSRARG